MYLNPATTTNNNMTFELHGLGYVPTAYLVV